MLVLGRKAGQSLLINDNIRISIIEVGSRQIKIGIEAPDDVKIFRNELLDNPDYQELNNSYSQV